MDKLISASFAMAVIYLAIVYLAAFVVEKLKLIEKPIVKNGFILSAMKNAGIFVFLGGFYLFAYSYFNKFVQPLGVVGGILICLIAISMGVVVKISRGDL